MSTLEKVRGTKLYDEWKHLIRGSKLSRVVCIFCPGHAGVAGNERADVLAGEAVVGEAISLDPPTSWPPSLSGLITIVWLHLPTPWTCEREGM